MARYGYNSLFTPLSQIPSTEAPLKHVPRRPVRPSGSVVKVWLPWPNGSTRHLTLALRAWLAHPVALPRDPGPGPHTITARLDLAVVGRGMAMAREPSRAAFIRRVLWWRYGPKPNAKPVPEPTSSPVAPSAVVSRPRPMPLPQVPASGRRELQHSEFRDWTDCHCGGRREPQSDSRYFLLPNGSVEQRFRADGSLQRIWECLFP